MVGKYITFIIIISKYRLASYYYNYTNQTKNKYLAKFLETIFYPLNIIKSPPINWGENLRAAFIELGPIYIKLGQTISASPKLAGNELAEELKLLQDRLPPFDFKYVKRAIFNSFKKDISELFSEFEVIPVSAASIAQVHKAKTLAGELVAVKILRPNIAIKYENDIKILNSCARFLNYFYPKFRRLNFQKIISILRKTMQMELNLLLEAAAASELSRNSMADKINYIPKIYWHLSSKEILTSEWIEGQTIYKVIEEKKFDQQELAEKLAISFFDQAFRDGFFHGDLHPGNILIMQDGVIALIDFGIMGRLEEKERLIIAEMLYQFLNHDYHEVAKLHLKAGYIPKNSNLELFAQNCKVAYEELIEADPNNLSIANLLKNLFKITEDFGMQTQPQLILLQKTMIIVEGLGRLLSPEKNMWELAKPHITKWAIKNLTFEAKIVRLIKKTIYKLDL